MADVPGAAVEPLATYAERSPGLRREFRLYPNHVTVHSRNLGGVEIEIHVPLEELSPEFGYLLFRSRRVVAGCVLSAGLAVILWLMVGPFDMPWTSPRVMVTAGLLVLSVAVAALYMPRYRAFRFVNRSGVVVLDMIESGPAKSDCHTFAKAVQASIMGLSREQMVAAAAAGGE